MTPSVREPKPAWSHLPASLRARLAAIVGGNIVRADIAWGGFGPSATFILHAANGAKYFCKGAHPGQTDAGNAAFSREKLHYETFPELDEFGPRYVGAAEEAGWHVLVLDCVERVKDVPPWDADSFAKSIDLVARFHAASPERAERQLQRAEREPGWSSLAVDGAARTRFLALFEGDAVHWFDKYIGRFVELETAAGEVGGPRSWLHLDIRSDNLLLAQDRVVLVDWPFLVYGPRLWDIAFFLPSVTGEGGPSPQEGLAAYERAAGIRFDASDVAIVAATIAGFFAARAGEPDIPDLPRLRWVQRLQLHPALAWACALLKITAPAAKLG